MLVRIVAMLTKLVERFDPDQYRVRESASSLGTIFKIDLTPEVSARDYLMSALRLQLNPKPGQSIGR